MKDDQQSILRPPIVSVLGHVDHGKTTLLDQIRSTSIASREAGGITQSIGASRVITKEGKMITFIDTPGHAAFSNMRSRGAKVADIAILVVAANDGIKPQTKEAIGFIRDADIPMIVAITKIDLQSGNAELVKEQLGSEGIKLEGNGGDTPVVTLSAKTGQGVDNLLEMIILVSEVKGVKASNNANLEAVVIETDKDKRGLLASAVVRNGTLSVGDEIFAGRVSTKVRGLFNYLGKSVASVYPGDSVQILGFDELPDVGSKIISKSDFSFDPKDQEIEKRHVVPKIEEGQIGVVIKASSSGGLEAILKNLPEKVVVVYWGVGDVTDTDVFMAKAANVKIFVFEAKVPSSVSKLAGTENVEIETFKIIYELFDRLDEMLKKGGHDVLGRAEILAIFPFSGKKVAGCKIFEGKFSLGDKFIIKRGEKEIGSLKALSFKKEKKEISEAKAGEELGILFNVKLDFMVGDMVLSVR